MSGVLTRAIIRFRLAIVVYWAVAVAMAWPRAARIDEAIRVAGSAVPGSESERAGTLLRGAFPQPIYQYFAVVMSGPEPLDSPRTRLLLERLVAAADAEPYVTKVLSFLSTRDSMLLSDDGRTTVVLAAVAWDETFTPTDRTSDFRRAIRAARARTPQPDGFEVYVTGQPALGYDARAVSREDARRGELRTLPISGAVLVLAFGGIAAAVLPLIIGIIGVACTLALIQAAAASVPISGFVLVLITMIGLAVGVDYSLLIVTRFREELSECRDGPEAAARALATAGRTVVASGLAVAVGFAALLITPIPETRSVALGGLLVVTVAVLLTVTLLPALLAFLGDTIDRPRWLTRRLTPLHASRRWDRWAHRLVRHPWRAIALGGLAVALLTLPLLQLKLGLPRTGWYPEHTESAEGVRLLADIGARGALQPIRVVLRAPSGNRVVASRYLRGLRELSDSVRADPRVGTVRSVVDLAPGVSLLQYLMLYSDLDAARRRSPSFYASYLSADARTTLVDVFLTDTTSFTGAMQVVRHVRAVAGTGAVGLDSVDIVVGGFAASAVDLQDRLLDQLPLIVALVFLSTTLTLTVFFRSVVAPLKAVAMNSLSVLGAFGVLVLVFQQGVGIGLFGLEEPTAAIMVIIPVVVFAVVFGLSMDYGVFMLARIKEAFDRSGHGAEATAEGLASTASVITSAAAIMLVVFGVFSFSRVLTAQMTGFGLAVAVFLDATLIRMVLFPAIMCIAEDWNWWPGIRVLSRRSH